MTMARRWQTQVGFKQEASYGSAVTPDQGMPVNEFNDQTVYNVIRDQGLRGIAAVDFKSLQGAGHSEISLGGHVYPEEIGYFLKLIMGAAAVGGGGPYTHTFTLGGSPGSLTLEADVVTGTNGGLRYKGVRLGQLAFKWQGAEGVLDYTATLMGHIASKVTATNPAATDNNPWQGWRADITSAGYANLIVSGDLTLNRELQVIHTGEATQDARYIAVGPLEVSGNLVIAVEDLTAFDNFLAHLSQAFTVAFDVGPGTKTITFLMTACSFADGPIVLDRGSVGLTFALPIRGIYNTTDAGPAKVTLVNAKASYA